jgi:pimeloyl-ACP methyl ester carboxylesterase
MVAQLNAIEVPARGGGPEKVGFILHGILGSAKNWRSFSRRLASTYPGWRWYLVDLRNHGESPKGQSPHTLKACANDLVVLAERLGVIPEVVIGHSFGGKVAMQYAVQSPAGLRCTWVLDTNPAPAQTDARRISSTNVVQVFRALKAVPQPLSSREELVAFLLDRGFARVLADWMTTNLRRDEDGFRWRFDLPGVAEMVDSYTQADFFETLSGAKHGGAVELVRAEWTEWPEGDRGRLSAMDEDMSLPFSYHILAGSGHWVHVERPNELIEMLGRTLEG